MRTFTDVVAAATKKQGKAPGEVTYLNLDCQCRVAQAEASGGAVKLVLRLLRCCKQWMLVLRDRSLALGHAVLAAADPEQQRSCSLLWKPFDITAAAVLSPPPRPPPSPPPPLLPPSPPPQGLEGYTALTKLSLASLGLKSLEGLPCQLTNLAVNDNNLAGGALTALTCLTNLRRLDLAGI